MHRSTCTSELERLDTVDDLQNETETEDPCEIGTPVCLPAVVWFENCDGEKELRIKYISLKNPNCHKSCLIFH